jgi:cell division protein FtsB
MANTVQKQKKSARRWLWVSLGWVVVPALLLGVFRLCCNNQPLMNFLVQRVTSPIKEGLSWLCAFCPIGIAEVIWAAAILGILAFLVRSVWLIATRPQKGRRLLRRVMAGVSIFLCIYLGYTVMWGINYYADTLCDQSDMEDRQVSAQELYTLMVAFADRASQLAEQVQRDEEGLYTQDLQLIFDQAVEAYAGVVEEFPCLAGAERQPKPMIFSRIMSYLDFTGFYFPFTGESLVNVDQPAYLVPATLLHELSHQRNIASEEECNFLAILAGLRSGKVDFEYSSCMMGYIHLSNALYKADKELQAEAATHLSDTARQDNLANSRYWAQFDTPVKTVGQTTYSNFMKSYDQSDGLASYGKCVDLLVVYYFDLGHPLL